MGICMGFIEFVVIRLVFFRGFLGAGRLVGVTVIWGSLGRLWGLLVHYLNPEGSLPMCLKIENLNNT